MHFDRFSCSRVTPFNEARLSVSTPFPVSAAAYTYWVFGLIVKGRSIAGLMEAATKVTDIDNDMGRDESTP